MSTAAAPAPPRAPLLLGTSAAASCPVKVRHAFDPTVRAPEPDDAPPPERVRAARTFATQQLAALVEAAPGLVVDLRLLDESDADAAAQACLRAMEAGASVVVGGLLPVDGAGHRVGRADLLLRGPDRPDGRPGYVPGLVRAHKMLLPRPASKADEEPLGLPARWTPFTAPWPDGAEPWPGAGMGFRLSSREADLVRLAHLHRLLAASGWAGQLPLGALLGSDTARDGVAGLAWVRLDRPCLRTASAGAEEGWRLRSVLERYDHEHRLRLTVARAAAARTGDTSVDPPPLVEPVVHDECGRCVWWARCRAELPDDEVSLNIGKGALDVREVVALRRLGVGRVGQLAGADVEALLPRYLPQVRHRSGTEGRLRQAVRRARMLRDGVDFDRLTTGAVELPTAALEVDLDVESSADGRVYLWGFLVHRTDGERPPEYVQFSRFAELDDAAEDALAAEAFRWLRRRVAEEASALVYHYSPYEPQVLARLAERSGADELAWAREGGVRLVDLYDTVKASFFGARGLGLKLIAQHAGFRWRDDDPGGLNSQTWFADAVGAADPQARYRARTRVLQYNEDDVRATHLLRQWLRALD